ncbi:hypothetical protein HW532_15765 [Kaustia mangrovi]|uniref:Uncharacterized protein n=1 Tax=Kaustia mangrovi TaxID=2593653 RepID=A0A7S8C608_9HYPH|nr:hypothetical protein [Kaustia mangrovi]QPC44019.1 hypothetical protein HW532_15765 [Kaustia mangrovi]
MAVSLKEQIAEVEREVRLREKVYGDQVKAGTMKKEHADYHLSAMRDVHRLLCHIREVGGIVKGIFDGGDNPHPVELVVKHGDERVTYRRVDE